MSIREFLLKSYYLELRILGNIVISEGQDAPSTKCTELLGFLEVACGSY